MTIRRAMTESEAAVMAELVSAKGRPLHADDIGLRLGIRERGVRYIVKALVEDLGIPIVSEPGEGGGFRLVNDLLEIERCKRGLFKQAFSVLRRARSFDRTGTAARLAGQLEIEIGGNS